MRDSTLIIVFITVGFICGLLANSFILMGAGIINVDITIDKGVELQMCQNTISALNGQVTSLKSQLNQEKTCTCNCPGAGTTAVMEVVMFVFGFLAFWGGQKLIKQIREDIKKGKEELEEMKKEDKKKR